MRSIHKSNEEPSVENIELFRLFAVEFQEKVYSFTWVPPANQVHRLSHVAFFMQSRDVKSVGAFTLWGLEHGSWTKKVFDSTRVWRGDSIVANKQLFRLLRLRGSPSLKREAQKLERAKRKLDKCSKCGALGHRKNMRVCPQYEQLEEHSDSDSDDGAVFSDEASLDQMI